MGETVSVVLLRHAARRARPFTICPNGFNCPAQLAGRIVHLASRDALDIEGLGDESAKLFALLGGISKTSPTSSEKPRWRWSTTAIQSPPYNSLSGVIGRSRTRRPVAW
jgi:hypothetical protein